MPRKATRAASRASFTNQSVRRFSREQSRPNWTLAWTPNHFEHETSIRSRAHFHLAHLFRSRGPAPGLCLGAAAQNSRRSSAAALSPGDRQHRLLPGYGQRFQLAVWPRHRPHRLGRSGLSSADRRHLSHFRSGNHSFVLRRHVDEHSLLRGHLPADFLRRQTHRRVWIRPPRPPGSGPCFPTR